MNTPHILIQGNPVDGFTYTGPFASHDDAVNAGDSVETDWWVAPLHEPEKDACPECQRSNGPHYSGPCEH